jgi:hypothetical protein
VFPGTNAASTDVGRLPPGERPREATGEQPVRFLRPGETAGPAAPPAGGVVEASGPVEWASDLVRELGRTHTGAGKLDLIQRAMRDRFDHPDHRHKPADHPDRHLTAAEAVEVLAQDETVGALTREKARQLAETGRYVPAAAAADVGPPPLPPPPKGQAPRRTAKPQPRAAAPEPAKADPPGPGVHDLSSGAVPTVGPKPADADDGRGAPKKPGRKD